MKIHFILVVLAAVFCFSIIIVCSYSNSEDHTGTTGTVENLEIIVHPANGISNQADSNEESPLLPSIGAFPGNSYSRHNQENVEIELIDYCNVFSEIQSNGYRNVSFEIQSNGQFNIFSESIEQHNVSSEIQLDAQSNVLSEPIEQHNISLEIQSDAQFSQLRRRHRPRKPNDLVINRPLVAENFSAIDLLIAVGPGRLIFELCTATIHLLNSWWKKTRRWREKIQVSCSSWVKAHVGFSCLMLASLYCFFYYQVVKGNAYALSIISYAALATSLCFSGKFKFGFEVVFFTSFLGRVGVPLMTIHLILVVLGGFFCYSFIIVLSYSDSQDRTGTPRSGVNLDQIRNDRANGVSNQADSSEESHPIGVSNEPMMVHRQRRP